MLTNVELLIHLPPVFSALTEDKLLLMHCGRTADINQQSVHENKDEAASRVALVCRKPAPKQLKRGGWPKMSCYQLNNNHF